MASAAPMRPTGRGIRGLQDRVAAIGGTLTIESPAGQGTLRRRGDPDRLTGGTGSARTAMTGDRPPTDRGVARMSRAGRRPDLCTIVGCVIQRPRDEEGASR